MKNKKTIKELRLENNLTQEELADKLFVSWVSVSYWENNRSNVSKKRKNQITAFFKVNVDDIEWPDKTKRLKK